MPDTLTTRMPTGIESLDPVLDGGIPPGSVVLLLGEIGSGHTEFVQSSISYLSMLASAGNGGDHGDHIQLPAEITYVTFTKMKEDVLQDIALSFNPELYNRLQDEVAFTDLSPLYFGASIVPPNWYGESDILLHLLKKTRAETGDLLAGLAQTLDNAKPDSLIVIDSLTDIATTYTDDASWHTFIAFLRGVQRAAKRWNSTIYLLLTADILNKSRETEIADCADALMLFRWEDIGAQRRQRIMYFEKFLGVMPHLEDRDLVKFSVKISAASGFEVRNIRVVI
jgi:KaiC/GvpD/RAD55 family RecA-like ATPase